MRESRLRAHKNQRGSDETQDEGDWAGKRLGKRLPARRCEVIKVLPAVPI